jgi:hypothetical protein
MGTGSKASGLGSVAMGNGTDAIGDYSMATGYAANALGTYSLGIGYASRASGAASISVGYFDYATGDYSTAIGYQTTASGQYSTALGRHTIASGDYSTALGSGATASGEGSIAMRNSDATGYHATSIGYNSTAAGYYSTTMGIHTKTSGVGSAAMGYGTTARSYACLAVGRYNDSIAGSMLSTWVETDPLFIIGNGADDDARHNAMTVLKNGNIGINTTNPQYGLHVVSDDTQNAGYVDGIMIENISSGANVGEAAISFKNDAFLDPNAKWIFGLNQNAYLTWDYGTEFAGSYAMRLDSLGNLTINGTYSPSDARLKKNLAPLQNSLQKIISLNGYHYTWMDQSRDQSSQTGLLAQEIEKEMPELVKQDEQGIKAVNYSGMVPYLIEAIKELQKQNNELKKRIEQLEKK